jgi:hypothetical protein
MDPEKIFLIVFFTLVMPAAWVFLTPIAKRMNREAERPSQPPPEVMEELERLHTRLAELEERVDFAERMLAEKREPDRIARGES